MNLTDICGLHPLEHVVKVNGSSISNRAVEIDQRKKIRSQLAHAAYDTASVYIAASSVG